MFHIDLTFDDVRIISIQAEAGIELRIIAPEGEAIVELTVDELALGLALLISLNGEGPDDCFNGVTAPCYSTLLKKLDDAWPRINNVKVGTRNPFRFIP